jgi:hypothetical protein
MRAFFHSWRRTAGVATLVMAAVVAGLWLRTNFATDHIQFAAFQRNYLVVSHSGGLEWHIAPLVTNEVRRVPWKFGWGSVAKNWGDPVPILTAPKLQYWMLVLPLTLLSAYLILWKPRKMRTT